MNPNVNENTIVDDEPDIEEDVPSPPYKQRISSKLSPAALHLLLS